MSNEEQAEELIAELRERVRRGQGTTADAQRLLELRRQVWRKSLERGRVSW